jgi:hypothetical protein
MVGRKGAWNMRINVEFDTKCSILSVLQLPMVMVIDALETS